MPLLAIIAHQNNLVLGGAGVTGVDTAARERERRRRMEEQERLAALVVLVAA